MNFLTPQIQLKFPKLIEDFQTFLFLIELIQLEFITTKLTRDFQSFLSLTDWIQLEFTNKSFKAHLYQLRKFFKILGKCSRIVYFCKDHYSCKLTKYFQAYLSKPEYPVVWE